MKRKLRNITITLEEEIAKWARVEAARATGVARQMVTSGSSVTAVIN
jgi:hypothetical protein